MRSSCSKKLRVENQIVREFLAELFGTFVFLSFSLASVAQYKLQQIGDTFNEANFLSGISNYKKKKIKKIRCKKTKNSSKYRELAILCTSLGTVRICFRLVKLCLNLDKLSSTLSDKWAKYSTTMD